MSKNEKTARVPFATLSRFIRLEMEGFHAGHGNETFRPVTELADALSMPVSVIEEAVRKMDGMAVVPVGDISQADFPRVQKKGGEKGYYPGVKLETEQERQAKATRVSLVKRAVDNLTDILGGLYTVTYNDDDTFTLSVSDEESALALATTEQE